MTDIRATDKSIEKVQELKKANDGGAPILDTGELSRLLVLTDTCYMHDLGFPFGARAQLVHMGCYGMQKKEKNKKNRKKMKEEERRRQKIDRKITGIR